MKKILKGNKGFSLVELLIALLIMAVIAGTAITLFGGVLETSKGGADRETAESIKRAILTYLNASNDTNFSALGINASHNGADGADATLVAALAETIVISDVDHETKCGGNETIKDGDDMVGKYGPFLEEAVEPTQNGITGWDIDIDVLTQIITVVPAETGSLTIEEATLVPATP